MIETVRPSPEILSALWCLQARAFESDWLLDLYARRWYAELLAEHHFTLPAICAKLSAHILARVISFDYAMLAFMAEYPSAPVLNLGCGFCSRLQRTNQRGQWWYQIDLPEVIGLRRAVHTIWPHEAHLEIDLAGPGLFEALKTLSEELHAQPLIIAEGLLSHLERGKAERLLWMLRHRFGKAALIGTAMRSPQAALANDFFKKYNIREHWGVQDEDELARIFGIQLQRTWSIAQLANKYGANMIDPEAGFMFQALL